MQTSSIILATAILLVGAGSITTADTWEDENRNIEGHYLPGDEDACEMKRDRTKNGDEELTCDGREAGDFFIQPHYQSPAPAHEPSLNFVVPMDWLP